MKRIVGIDPGLKGSIVFINEDMSDIEVFNMPTTENRFHYGSFIKKIVDPLTVNEILSENLLNTKYAVLENVKNRSKDGGSSIWSFSSSFFIVWTCLQTLRIHTKLVTAQEWKKKFGLINLPKIKSKELLHRTFPEFKKKITRIDQAEAFFIGLSVSDIE